MDVDSVWRLFDEAYLNLASLWRTGGRGWGKYCNAHVMSLDQFASGSVSTPTQRQSRACILRASGVSWLRTTRLQATSHTAHAHSITEQTAS